MYRDYSPKGVRFYFIYKTLAHPEAGGYVQPFTIEERLMHIQEARRRLGSGIPWLCDTMDNATKHRLGDAPNSEFLVGPDGKIVRRRLWSDPDALRKDLERLVAPVARPTSAADLNLPRIVPSRDVARGVVKRVSRSPDMQPLEVVPEDDGGEPYYAKLRAEAGRDLLRNGSGRLYLGFHMDPLYAVHWNNLSRPVHVEIVPADDSTEVSPSVLDGPKVSVASDADPREFLVAVTMRRRGTGSLRVRVTYLACDDDQTWCKAIQQEYTVKLTVDRDGGRVMNRGSGSRVRPSRGGRAGVRRPGRRSGMRGGTIVTGRIQSIDRNNGRITVRISGKERSFQVTRQTFVLRNRQPDTTESLRRGDLVRMQVQDDDETEPPRVQRMMVFSR